MLKLVSSVGNAAYKAAAKSGLAAGTEQPPYPCALPLPTITDLNDTEKITALADSIYESSRDLLSGTEHEWKSINYRDPDGGDVVLSWKPHIGSYNFAHGTMTFENTTPEFIMKTAHNDDFASRKRYSSDLAAFKILERPTPTTEIQYHEYKAPPPVSSRHLIYLVDRRYVASEDAYYICGCSIDYPMGAKVVNPNTIMAICLWAWEFTQVGDHTLCTYSNAMNPNGWTPPFILNFMKSEIAKELVAIRRVVYEARDAALGDKKVTSSNGMTSTTHQPAITENSSYNNNNNNNNNKNDSANSNDAGDDYDDVLLEEDELQWRHLQESEELIFF